MKSTLKLFVLMLTVFALGFAFADAQEERKPNKARKQLQKGEKGEKAREMIAKRIAKARKQKAEGKGEKSLGDKKKKLALLKKLIQENPQAARKILKAISNKKKAQGKGQFLKDHPRAAQFLKKHPKAAKMLKERMKKGKQNAVEGKKRRLDSDKIKKLREFKRKKDKGKRQTVQRRRR